MTYALKDRLRSFDELLVTARGHVAYAGSASAPMEPGERNYEHLREQVLRFHLGAPVALSQADGDGWRISVGMTGWDLVEDEYDTSLGLPPMLHLYFNGDAVKTFGHDNATGIAIG